MDYSSTNQLLPEEATREIRGIAKVGSVIPSDHILYDHPERNYDMQDVDQVLSNGEVREPPEYDKEYDNWVYKVEGNAVEGDKATVVVTIVSHREIFCITIKPK